VIPPGAVLGVLGSGQLGRMFTIAARQMGYRVHTFSPESDTPTGQVADVEVTASYDDADALRAFARQVSVVTFEFENVPSAATETLESQVPVRPSPMALHVSQHRAREKQFLSTHGIPTVPYAVASSEVELADALALVGTPAIVKTAAFGYDGKGQQTATATTDVHGLWTTLGGGQLVVEKRISLQAELSVIAARSVAGDVVQYPLFENRHASHILDLTTAPALVPPAVAAQATEIGRAILTALDYVGVLCRSPHDRRGRDQPIRTASARGIRVAAWLSRARASCRDGESAGRSVVGGRPRLGRSLPPARRQAAPLREAGAQAGAQDGSPDGDGAHGARGTGARDRRARRPASLTARRTIVNDEWPPSTHSDRFGSMSVPGS
jgi:hypothetical protein